MGFRPMMSALMRSKTGPFLVALQIAVTLSIVINALFIIAQRIEKINRPTGIDVPNVIVVDVRGFGAGFDVVDSITNDIDLPEIHTGYRRRDRIQSCPVERLGVGHGIANGT